MTPKEIYRFIIEQSPEPLIKNPVLRKVVDQERLGFYLGKKVPSQGTLEDADTKKAEDALSGVNETMKIADLQRQGHIGHYYAGGGNVSRANFYKGMSAKKAPQKLKLEKEKTSSGFAGDRKLTAKQMDALDPDYLGKISMEDPDYKGREKNVKVYRSGATKYGSVLDDAFDIRNIIVNNKGNIFGLEELGEKAEIFTTGSGSRKGGKGNRPDIRRVRTALTLAKDSFPEIANFKFVTERYPGIDGKERHQLNMVVNTIKNYQNTTGDEKLAQFLPDNMGQFYTRVIEKGPKKLPGKPEQGLFIKMYNFKPHQIKYISDRITDETGQKFTSKDYKNLVNEVKGFRKKISIDKGLEKKLAFINNQITDLANDTQIQNLLKGDLNRKTQEALLARATQIVGGDASIASRRLFQMAEAMSDSTNKYKNLGIEINNEKANKIIVTGKKIGGRSNRYGMSSVLYDYYGNVVDKAIGSGEGQTFIGKYQQAIRKALDKGQSPDEIFSLTASARTRAPGQGNLAPYALFTQQLRTDVNSAIKGAYIDSALSRTHGELQEIFKGRKYSQLNAADKKAANDLVEAFEKEKVRGLNQPVNPGEVRADFIKQYGEDSTQYKMFKKNGIVPKNYKGVKPIYLTAAEKKNMQLPSFDLKNPPSKSIEGFNTRFVKYPQIKKAFEKSYKDVGYSMKVTKDMKTQKEFLSGLTKNLRKAGFDCALSEGVDCDDPNSYRKSMKETMQKASQGDNAAVRRIQNLGKIMNTVKGAAKATGYGALIEIGFAAPLATIDWARGANKQEIVSNATLGFFGRSMDEQLRDKDLRYKQIAALEDAGTKEEKMRKRLETAGGYRSIAQSQKMLENAMAETDKAAQPFLRVNPQLESGQMFDQDKYFSDVKYMQDAMAKEQEAKKQRALKRGFYQPDFDVFEEEISYAGGGIAGIRRPSAIPPQSGPLPDGLPGVLKRVKNI